MMETESNSLQKGQEVPQITEWLARLVLERTGQQIDLNQPAFVDFLLRNQVTNIALAVLLPTDGGPAAQIVYLDRNPDAVFQLPALDPLSFETGKPQSLRQSNVRRDAPKEVRHHTGDDKQPDSFQGHAATLKSASIVDHTTLSSLEQSIGGRYIHAGEFAWLCLLWVWTGEPEDRQTMQVSEYRSVMLEQFGDTKDGKGPLLLNKLCEVAGLRTELQQLYDLSGKLQADEEGKYWKRSSNRLQDFEALGFLASASDNSKALTKKAQVFTDWLYEAVTVLVSDITSGPESPNNLERLRRILNPAESQTWTDELTRWARILRDACNARESSIWVDALNSLLNAFPHQPQRGFYREVLRTDGFPVYPLVHMTMLFGLEVPLDWLAIPLGAMMDGDDTKDTCEHWPQAAAFILALHREPDMVSELVAVLRPVLSWLAFVESGDWIQKSLHLKSQEAQGLRIQLEEATGGLVAASPAMKQVLKQAGALAHSDRYVLILGEKGTGKTALARYIHARSKRASKPMVERNVAAISPTLIESELFGHVKGAYTHAMSDRAGAFERSDGGILFLDEIGILTEPCQATFLKVLEDKKFTRVGGNKEIESNFRLIAATNSDIFLLANERRFRGDLLDRINQELIRIPPLREREADILPLFKHFFERAHGNGSNLSLDDDMRSVLLTHDWPGNVRGLKNVAEHFAEFSWSEKVVASDISAFLALSQPHLVPYTPVAVRDIVELSTMESPPEQECLEALKRIFFPVGATAGKMSVRWDDLPSEQQQAVVVILQKLLSRGTKRQKIIRSVGFSGPTFDKILKSASQCSATN